MDKRYAKIDCGASGDNTLVGAVADQKLVLLGLVLVTNADVAVTFKDGSTAVTGAMSLPADGDKLVWPPSEVGYLETSVGAALVLNLSGTVAVDGCLTYGLLP